jgi:parvulin-like peptidyl-prolyl isomerase
VEVEHTGKAFSPADLRKVAVRAERGSLSVRELLEALRTMTDRQRSWLRSKEEFEDVAAGLVMRWEVARVARADGLDRSAEFAARVSNAFETYLLGAVEDGLRARVSIPTDSLRAFHRAHADRFLTPPEVRLSLILLDDAVMADSVHRALRQGVSFEDVARRFSVQRATADRGGDAGFLRREGLGALGDQLFGLEAGAWRGPFTLDGKFLFARCTGKRPPHRRSFEECAQEIRDELSAFAWQTARRQAVQEFKKKIVWRQYPEKLALLSLSSSLR